MIVTLTMNPSVDRTAQLPAPLVVGGVNRIASVDDSPGGKGVNVARVVAAGGVEARAVFPAPPGDPFVTMCAASGVATSVVPATGGVRVNLTLADPDGTTTKINAPGPELDPATLERVRSTVADLARDAQWVVLCGSVPRGVEADIYADLVTALRPVGARLAVDTSDAPLAALAARLPDAAPDLVKPNGEELGQLAGVDGAELERRAARGDTAPVVAAARALRDRGVGAVLVTLGGAGAVLVDDDETWFANTPAVQVRSTVGAGDSALAGYLLAGARGLPPRDRLAWAVCHGSVAASLPGTGLPLGLDPATFRPTLRRLD
ncbi:1-phosphofructokinase family hexose kinase [Dietzia cinnamea]|uniref:1-phosphofructokinase n=1 Tax=Dietzia cinnamea TaxID=321318 RepID=A0A177LD36_9ACTN|nr:1-phosphofructokinase family hexose kinase [Dietzia cinnamea]MCT2264860.1 1-phosphofructokinase family hexose kinase [Dietzia cinnamea]OAH63464.1 1-phosphofructokinase [Dietzia cinnamea]TCW23361.1 1-phosphofructokinase [Dietzia cinnamea]